MTEQDAQKQRAAERAVAEIHDGMVLGLGSGSTVAFVLEALAARVAAGLRIVAIPSSEQTATAARRLGIPLTDFAAHRRIDLTLDGADQVVRGTLDLVKGLGGALLREKMVALASEAVIVVADQSKLVETLGGKTRLPVEITRFGAPVTLDRLTEIAAAPQLRRAGHEPFVTDNGNYIADCSLAEIADPAALDARLRSVFGVVATGLFVGLATMAVIGTPSGVELLRPTPVNF
ncbi:MAG TPA: ribose-5-phosphate isomerase RpiA [Stellaceae bacterium]|nr:ribose-5-phosphate isomerase RpiA [Stellaceae bacterium]